VDMLWSQGAQNIGLSNRVLKSTMHAHPRQTDRPMDKLHGNSTMIHYRVSTLSKLGLHSLDGLLSSFNYVIHCVIVVGLCHMFLILCRLCVQNKRGQCIVNI